MSVDVATGTGAKLYAYGEDIGRVTSINMQEQGYQFNADGVLIQHQTSLC